MKNLIIARECVRLRKLANVLRFIARDSEILRKLAKDKKYIVNYIKKGGF